MKLNPGIFASPPAAQNRSAGRRLVLPALAVLVAAFWLMAWEIRGKVAPTGVAAPAGPRHADAMSARVASMTPEERHDILLCQALGPAAPCDICGVDCSTCNCRRRAWEAARATAWQAYAQGEYVGHERLAHVPEYRLRVDDQLDMVYRLTRDETPTPYRLNVGDEVQVESFTDRDINRKSKEVVLAVRLEQELSKQQILEKYLNTVYFGAGASGVEAAAETFWGVPASQLGYAEGAMLAAVIANPVGYDPTLHPPGGAEAAQLRHPAPGRAAFDHRR